MLESFNKELINVSLILILGKWISKCEPLQLIAAQFDEVISYRYEKTYSNFIDFLLYFVIQFPVEMGIH